MEEAAAVDVEPHRAEHPMSSSQSLFSELSTCAGLRHAPYRHRRSPSESRDAMGRRETGRCGLRCAFLVRPVMLRRFTELGRLATPLAHLSAAPATLRNSAEPCELAPTGRRVGDDPALRARRAITHEHPEVIAP